MSDLSGQWIGVLDGDLSGQCMLELDVRDSNYVGSANLFTNELSAPDTRAIINVPREDISSFGANIIPIDNFGNELNAEQFKQIYPDYSHGARAAITITETGENLFVTYTTDSSSGGQGTLTGGWISDRSSYLGEESIQGWADFKNHISSIDVEKYIFRGQNAPFKLRTSFHRTARTDLARYLDYDIHQVMKRYLSPLLPTQFNLADPDQLGAFFNLLQHHGFPTPLLDWSESPFVASYFAFRDLPKTSDESIRIFMLDKTWSEYAPQDVRVSRVRPHVSIMYLGGFLNDRVLPQQAVNLLCNVDDIERFIAYHEKAFSRTFLRVFDLPRRDRDSAMLDLKRMGITSASLFPGLDGLCEALRFQQFEL